jgi:hypothetical protein
MRYLMLLAAFATLDATPQPGPGGPADPASPHGNAPVADLPPLLEPELRAEGAEALQRSDAVHAGTDVETRHDHDGGATPAEPASGRQDPHAGHAAPGKEDAAPPPKDHEGHGMHHKHHGAGGHGGHREKQQ